MRELTNLGFSVVRPSQAGAQGTLIVVGVARSGTSMVAAALGEMGIPLGKTADAAVHEDTEIAEAIERNDARKLATLIADRNGTYDKWAFKRPEAFLQLPPILPMFRRPRVIATFRDPSAIAQRNVISMQMDFLKLLGHAAGRTMQLIRFIEQVNIPVFTVSYEKAMSEREAFLDALCEFGGLRPTDEQRNRSLKVMTNGPELYLQATRIA